MPYSREADYYHKRLRDPREFIVDTFRNVPISHTDYNGKWQGVNGVMAIVGVNRHTKQWEVQSILIPKRGHNYKDIFGG